ncbi:uncharacterized protein RJT21DRAFT_41866 [Scheffersomyces amazonensis]|uniref:uncharacterized protein n=1 Tax=Scheffersomyces amazonensis TaxID=1078765 RepID=UPI00315CA958
MSSTRYLLATVAIAGGAYWYDQNVQPIIPRQQRNEIKQELNKFQDKAHNQIVQPAQDLNNKLTKEIKNSKQELTEAKDSRLYKEIKAVREDIQASYDKAVKDIDEDKNILVKAVGKYIDAINSIGESATSKANETREEVTQQVEKSKGWFEDWFGSKTDKVEAELEKSKKDWLNWGTSKQDELSKNYENTKKQLGERFDKEKQRAIEQYEIAKKNFDNLVADLQPDSPNREQKLSRAKQDLTNSVNNLKAYGDDLYKDYSAKISNLFK